MINKEYQVTIICETNKYKPVSTIVTIQQTEDIDWTQCSQKKKEIITKGVQKICNKHYWNKSDLLRLGYTKSRVRVYDKASIEAAAKARYEAIKEEKYNTGEWKRPKAKE